MSPSASHPPSSAAAPSRRRRSHSSLLFGRRIDIGVPLVDEAISCEADLRARLDSRFLTPACAAPSTVHAPPPPSRSAASAW